MTHLRWGTVAVIGAEVETPDEWFGRHQYRSGSGSHSTFDCCLLQATGDCLPSTQWRPPSTVGIIKRRSDRRRIVNDFISAAAACAEVGFGM
jgi:hypothetical protein